MAFINNITSGNATIDYARMLHLSNAFAFNQFGIGKLINLPWFINYPVNNGSVPSYDPDASAWFSAVEATGSTISNVNKSAFNTAFLALKSSNIWDKITQGCFFVGIDGANPLTGAFTPFKTISGTTPTNVNFTTSDYNRLTGIIQDGGLNNAGTKYIDTGVLNALGEFDENPAYPLGDRHALLYNSRNNINDNYLIGSIYKAEADVNSFKFALDGSLTNSQWQLAYNNFTDTLPPTLDINNGGRGLMGVSGDAISTGLTEYIFENTTAIFGVNPENPNGPLVFALSATNVLIAPTPTGIKRIAYYSLGSSLADGAQLTTYGSIINTLLSSLA